MPSNHKKNKRRMRKKFLGAQTEAAEIKKLQEAALQNPGQKLLPTALIKPAKDERPVVLAKEPIVITQVPVQADVIDGLCTEMHKAKPAAAAEAVAEAVLAAVTETITAAEPAAEEAVVNPVLVPAAETEAPPAADVPATEAVVAAAPESEAPPKPVMEEPVLEQAVAELVLPESSNADAMPEPAEEVVETVPDASTEVILEPASVEEAVGEAVAAVVTETEEVLEPAAAVEEAVGEAVTETEVAAVEEAVPAVEEAVPAVEEAVPAVEEAVPAVEEAVPAVEEAVPAVVTETEDLLEPAVETVPAVVSETEVVPGPAAVEEADGDALIADVTDAEVLPEAVVGEAVGDAVITAVTETEVTTEPAAAVEEEAAEIALNGVTETEGTMEAESGAVADEEKEESVECEPEPMVVAEVHVEKSVEEVLSADVTLAETTEVLVADLGDYKQTSIIDEMPSLTQFPTKNVTMDISPLEVLVSAEATEALH